jgi:hypothetical protein
VLENVEVIHDEERFFIQASRLPWFKRLLKKTGDDDMEIVEKNGSQPNKEGEAMEFEKTKGKPNKVGQTDI